MTQTLDRSFATSSVPAPRKIVIVSDQIPGHDAGFAKSGHAQYVSGFIDFFTARGCEVVLTALRPRPDFVGLPVRALDYRIVSPSLRTIGGRLVPRSPLVLARTLAWMIYARLPRRFQAWADGIRGYVRRARGFAHDLGTFATEEERAHVRAVVARERPDLVVYDGIFNACGTPPCGTAWLVTHEVKHERAASFVSQGIGVRPAGFDAGTERGILRDVGNVIAIQWDDADAFSRMVPEARIVVVPVPVAIAARPPAARAGASILFVGSGSYHNSDGLRWFLDTCWPVLRAARPDVRLDVYGSVCYRLGAVPQGVALHGEVSDLGDAYENAALAIVPLRIGSGLKVKIVEAMAYGMPIVTTPVGAQGLRSFEPLPFRVADDAATFAAACLSVLASDEERDRLADAARSCARRFTPEEAFADFGRAVGFARSERR